jgi:regulator of sirC expression with transglutaminase-like and TPR domain
MSPHEAYERWVSLLAGDDWALEEASLLYAAAEYPALQVERYFHNIELLAEEARRDLGALSDASPEPAARLCRYLFEIRGYLGNKEAYDDPRNSYLNEVIDRNLGIPITLSVLGLAVASRLDISLDGVGMPGHFLLRSPHGPTFFDPFAGGLRSGVADCRARFDAIYGGAVPWSNHYLDPTPKRMILARMLMNLKRVYAHQGDFQRLQRISEFSLALQPDSPQDLEILKRIGDWQSGTNG